MVSVRLLLWERCLKGSKLYKSVQTFWTVALFQTGHGGADEDGPAGLAERHGVRLTDIQVLWDLIRSCRSIPERPVWVNHPSYQNFWSSSKTVIDVYQQRGNTHTPLSCYFCRNIFMIINWALGWWQQRPQLTPILHLLSRPNQLLFSVKKSHLHFACSWKSETKLRYCFLSRLKLLFIYLLSLWMFDSELLWMQFYIYRRLNKGLTSFIFHNLLVFSTSIRRRRSCSKA